MTQRRPKVYIAGPMRGKPYYNYAEFDAAAQALDVAGYDPVGPHTLDLQNGLDVLTMPRDSDWTKAPDGFDMKACIKRDIDALLGCDAVLLLDGWADSTGAVAEMQVARWNGIPCFHSIETLSDAVIPVVKQSITPRDAATLQESLTVGWRVTNSAGGVKDCGGKHRWSLIPWREIGAWL